MKSSPKHSSQYTLQPSAACSSKPTVFLWFVCSFFVLTSVHAFAGDTDFQRMVTVSASGEVMAEPDIILIRGDIRAESKKADKATKEAQKKLAAVTDYLLSQGVESKDIQAASVQVHPQWHYPRNKPRELTGYQAIARVNFTLRKLESLPSFYVKLPEKGLDAMNPNGFDFSNREELENQAIAAATQKAKRKAESALSSLGNSIGAIQSLSVNSRWNHPPVQHKMMRAAVQMEADASQPKLNVGHHKITAEVTASFLIK